MSALVIDVDRAVVARVVSARNRALTLTMLRVRFEDARNKLERAKDASTLAARAVTEARTLPIVPKGTAGHRAERAARAALTAFAAHAAALASARLTEARRRLSRAALALTQAHKGA